MREEVVRTSEILRKGGSIIYPTDTIWGLGCDATSPTAVDKIYRIKERDPKQSMLVLVADIKMAENYLEELPEVAIQLFELSDKPLTLILEGAIRVAENLPAQDRSIGMRIPKDEFCQMLLKTFRKPIVSTSANLSGKPSPGCFQEIDKELLKRVDYVVDWKRAEASSKKASSIIRLGPGGEVRIIRS